MPASYPSSAKVFTTKSDGPGNTIMAAHVNDLQLEVTAIETDLLAGLPLGRGGTGLTAIGTRRRKLTSTGSLISFQTLWVEQTTTATGGQDNFDLDGSCTLLRCTGAAPNFTGFTVATAAPSAGDMVIVQCLGTTVKVTDQATSTAANQIVCDSTQGQIVGVNGTILLVYDGTTTRWRASVLEQGAPITYTPTWTAAAVNPAIGNGTLTGRYVQRGKTCWVELNLVAGGTTTFGTGVYSWALPLTAASADKIHLSGEILDSGTAFWMAFSRGSGGTTGTVTVGSAGSTTASSDPTVPMTWATNDYLRLGGEYEIA